ncbi:urease accessory protein UreD [Halalkalibacter krulwichiae]|nr:urease accessory protein UreD [Halalkalibacter krulwichiae]
METSGGMVAGDWNAYTFLVEDDCDVTLIPQSSTKVYPSKFDFACRQTIEMTVGANARVKWLPETTIPFENSIFLADTKIHLQENSSLVFGEIFSSGRQKSAESFEFRRFSSKTNIYVNDQIIVFDHLDINKEASPLFELGMFEEHTYMGSIWLIDQSLASREWEFPFFKSASHRFGMTQLDDYGVHFRWLTNDLCLLKEQMEQVISEV